jgi:hypothetical protein
VIETRRGIRRRPVRGLWRDKDADDAEVVPPKNARERV